MSILWPPPKNRRNMSNSSAFEGLLNSQYYTHQNSQIWKFFFFLISKQRILLKECEEKGECALYIQVVDAKKPNK